MKKRLFVSLLIIAISTLIAVEARSVYSQHAKANEDSSTGGWEYLVVQGGNVNLSPSDGGPLRKAEGAFSQEYYPLEKNMDKLGAKGWELVAVASTSRDPVYYFKRRK